MRSDCDIYCVSDVLAWANSFYLLVKTRVRIFMIDFNCNILRGVKKKRLWSPPLKLANTQTAMPTNTYAVLLCPSLYLTSIFHQTQYNQYSICRLTAQMRSSVYFTLPHLLVWGDGILRSSTGGTPGGKGLNTINTLFSRSMQAPKH